MTENDRKILARACGLCWHEYTLSDGHGISYCSCGNEGYSVVEICTKANPTFSTPDDWNLVRVRVAHKYLTECGNYLNVRVSIADPPEVLCEATLNWIKTRPDLFPWVVDFLREKEGK